MSIPTSINTAELEGIEARRVEIETDLHPGLPAFIIVGLADKALSESKERISAALKNSGVKPPSGENHRIIVSLAPADIKKTGSHRIDMVSRNRHRKPSIFPMHLIL